MTFDTLLSPTDGSGPAEAATAREIGLAEQLDVTLHCVSMADQLVRRASVPVTAVHAVTGEPPEEPDRSETA